MKWGGIWSKAYIVLMHGFRFEIGVKLFYNNLLRRSMCDPFRNIAMDPHTEKHESAPGKVEICVGGYTFSSNFDSGNLNSAEFVDGVYQLYTAEDCEGISLNQTAKTSYTSWFYFSLSGGVKGQTIQIQMMHLNKHGPLYENGMRPVHRSLPSKPKWTKITQALHHEIKEKRSTISFSHTFKHNEETEFFAFCFPYGYDELQRKLNIIQENNRNFLKQNIYVHRELICHSLDGRRIELVTISSLRGKQDEEEDRIDRLFQDRSTPRSAKFQNKKVVFISARVHPGETPASYMMDGVINFLLRCNDPRSIALREHFVFKLVPMLNPDGVARGYYRLDPLGENLNRVYQEPKLDKHPSVYAAKALALYHHQRGVLEAYLDLHAHASRRGCFIFGNNLPSTTDQVQNILFAKLVGLNSVFFEFDQCDFSVENMLSKDKRDLGKSKEGSGRVALYRETLLRHIYTVECNYNMGKKCSFKPAASGDAGLASPSKRRGTKVPSYTSESWKDVGKGLLLGFLDLHGLNPWSRIAQSPWKSIQGMEKVILSNLQSKMVFREAGRSSTGKAHKAVLKSIKSQNNAS